MKLVVLVIKRFIAGMHHFSYSDDCATVPLLADREPRPVNRTAKDLRKEIDTYSQEFTLASRQQFDNPSVSNQTYRARVPRMLCSDFPLPVHDSSSATSMRFFT